MTTQQVSTIQSQSTPSPMGKPVDFGSVVPAFGLDCTSGLLPQNGMSSCMALQGLPAAGQSYQESNCMSMSFYQLVPAMTIDATTGFVTGSIYIPVPMNPSMCASPMPITMPGTAENSTVMQANMPFGAQEDNDSRCQEIAASTSKALLEALLEGRQNRPKMPKAAWRTQWTAPTGITQSAATSVTAEQTEDSSQTCIPKPRTPGAVIRAVSGSSCSSVATTAASFPTLAETTRGLGGQKTRHRRSKKGLLAPALSAEDDYTAEEPVMNASAVSEFTTVMVKNVPNKYSRDQLVAEFTKDFKGLIDFLYLPIDFKNGCNIGYCFINFVSSNACGQFMSLFNERSCIRHLESKKRAEVKPARIQGFEENVKRLRNSAVMNELLDHPDWMPLILDSNGDELPFPMPQQPIPPVRPRSSKKVP